MRSPNLRCLLLVSALLYGAPALAQDDEPPPEYQNLIERALGESADGRWEEARAYFHRAHAAFPNARTRRGIGVVSFELRDYVDAVRHLRRALTEQRRALTAEQRAEVEALLERALPLVASYSTDALPSDAELVVDGHPPTLEPDGTLLLSIGEHQLRVDGPRSGEARVSIRGGESGPLPVVLAEGAPRPPPPDERGSDPVAEPRVPDPVDPALSPSGGVPDAAIGLAVGGALVALAGAAVLIAGLVDLSTVQGAAQGTEWADLAGSYDRAPVLTGVGAALVGAGTAGLLGGAIWIAVSPPTGPDARTMLRLGGTF